MHEADDANVFGATRWTVPQPSECGSNKAWHSRLSPNLQLQELCVRRGPKNRAPFRSADKPLRFADQKKPGTPHFCGTSGLSELGMRHQQTTAFLGRPADVAKNRTMPRDRRHASAFGGA